MQENGKRATKSDITERIHRLLGARVEEDIVQATDTLLNGDIEQGLHILRQLDSEIGGFGLHSLASDTESQIPYQRSLHRPIQYVEMIFKSRSPTNFTRFLSEMACAHVEATLKKSPRLKIMYKIREMNRGVPMGTLLGKIKKQKLIPPLLHDDLSWLNRKIYRFVKHEYGREVFADELPESDINMHLFSLGEATMIYFIARKLVVTLEEETKNKS